MLIWMLVAFVFILGPLMFLHELGHFWAAKRNGIAVDEFGFGLGPKLITLFEHDGTEYTIRAIPFAAFVRLAGEEDASLESGMMTAPRKARFTVAAAGPLMNIAVTLVLLWIAYLFGPPAFTRVVLSAIDPGAPAERAGFQVGDLLLEVDGIEVTDTSDLADYTSNHLGQEITLLVERDGQELSIGVTPRKEGEYDPSTEGPIGVGMHMTETGPAVSQNVLQAGRSAAEEFGGIVKATANWPGMIINALKARAERSVDDTTPIPPEEDLRYLRPLGIFGILQLIAVTTQAGVLEGYWFYIFRIAGLISIALGMTNLLPLPGLDGGRILFVILDWLSEHILHRNIDPEREILVHAAGIFLLLVLMVFITWKDITDPLIQFATSTPTP